MARALAADPLVLLMDEPFSAVDPVVRGELHEFFLGLQRELSKTIIMITHDIDEAIKLGDQVAILRVGGKLAQVGTPQQLLDEPADAFVEGFVGKDRGYRSLSFQPASGLTLGDVQVVREAGFTGGDAPVLVVDGDARPVGWSDPARSGSVMALGATFDPETDSLRTALDAALTSPVGLAVAVAGESRRYAGVVDADMILHQVTQARAQIAESIAVRTHDEQPTADVAAGRRSVGPAGTVRRSGRDIGPGRPPGRERRHRGSRRRRGGRRRRLVGGGRGSGRHPDRRPAAGAETRTRTPPASPARCGEQDAPTRSPGPSAEAEAEPGPSGARRREPAVDRSRPTSRRRAVRVRGAAGGRGRRPTHDAQLARTTPSRARPSPTSDGTA